MDFGKIDSNLFTIAVLSIIIETYAFSSKVRLHAEANLLRCIRQYVYHTMFSIKKKEVSVSTENFFAPIFRLSQKYMCSFYENSGKTTAEFMQICENFLQSRNPLELGLLSAQTAGSQPCPQEQTPFFRRRFRWSKCSVQKEAIL